MSIDHGNRETGQAHPIARFAGRVGEVLDGLAEAPAWSMTPDEQRTALVDLTRAQSQMAELRLRVLAAGDNNDIAKDDAASSTAAWLAHQTRQERPRAHADVRLASALDTGFDATRRALAAGSVNDAQARVIVAAVTALPDTVSAFDRGRAEGHLVGLAAEYDARALRVFGNKIFEVIDPDAAERLEGEKLATQERDAARTTYLNLRDNGDGTHSGRFKILTLHAQMLKKALSALISPRRIGKDAWIAPDGTKTPRPELLGRGLCEFIERYPIDKLPKAGGLNATVVVTMTLDQLTKDLAAASLDTGGAISAGQARRLACQAGIIPVVLGGKSEVLDVGHQNRFPTKAIRIATQLRDQTCLTNGCDRPAGWCDFHHLIPWSKGGRTSVKDGTTLCPWHHHRAHDSAYDMTRMPNGQLRFHRRT